MIKLTKFSTLRFQRDCCIFALCDPASILQDGTYRGSYMQIALTIGDLKVEVP